MDELDFFREAMKLKEIKRTGWVLRKIPEPESVAAHMYAVSLLALVVPLPKNVDRNRLVKMCLLHDVGEIKTGDVVWESRVFSEMTAAQKEKNEMDVAKNIFPSSLADLKDITIECLEEKTPTAKFLKELDKLEVVVQALRYQELHDPEHLDEFWENAQRKLTTPVLKDWLKRLVEERKQLQEDI